MIEKHQASERTIHRTRSGKVRLRSIEDLDNRTAAAQRAHALVAGLESDAGGAEYLSTGQKELCKHAALTGAILDDLEVGWIKGEKVDIAGFATLVNSQRRLLESIGLQRHPRMVGSTEDDQLTREFLDALKTVKAENTTGVSS